MTSSSGSSLPLKPIPHLPSELNDLVVDSLHDDWRSLVSCYLSGHHCPFASRAKFRLTHSIDIPISESDPHGELSDFIKVFHAGSPLVPLVRSVHIHGPRDSILRAVLPADTDLAHLTHLRALKLSYLLVDSKARLAHFLYRLPALAELTCEGLAMQLSGRLEYTMDPLRHDDVDRAAMSGFCSRLEAVTLVDGVLAFDVPAGSPYDSILAIFAYGWEAHTSATPSTVVIHGFNTYAWGVSLGALCRNNVFLQHLGMTIYETVCSMDTAYNVSCWESLARCPSLHTLCLRYYPWRSFDSRPTSETVQNFVHTLSELLGGSRYIYDEGDVPGAAPYPDLESF